ncbi:hypothetical protein CC78DRAFT_581072 [Lojkania enalia]|uniref:Uncharacterized protein n=1 Tax=Lojkania enalia TaxID=147567 RepID=A0A9P4K7V2_9PLEO|nr:hypothetical protein CC78DRAFT_581072 [Didymosphaeria enalia]
MSAPNPGRQSPDPERQSGAQQSDPPASEPNEQGGAPSVSHAKEASDNQKANLASNPTHPLEKFAEEKTKARISFMPEIYMVQEDQDWEFRTEGEMHAAPE